MGAFHSGIGCSYSDVAPRFASVYNSIANAVGATAGVIAPILTAYCITAFPGLLGWKVTFAVSVALSWIAEVLWYFNQTSDIVAVLNTPTSKYTAVASSSGGADS